MANDGMNDAELLDLKRRLGKYSCECGSGGPMACDEDCPGDTTDSVVKEALIVLVDEVIRLRAIVQRS